ncbi:MAG: Homoserine O-acetyltransferase [Nitrosopumilus sp.]|nr:Homoserine O-acetyltransferase [Nitrosopumilus sp.]
MNLVVKDIMTSDVISTEEDLPIKEIAKILKEKAVSCVVLTDKGIPDGVITERDFVRRVVAENVSPDISVSEVMSTQIEYAKPTETIWDVANKMNKKQVRRMPVRDGNKLVGIITVTDIVRACGITSNLEVQKMTQKILLRMAIKKNIDNS